MHEALGGADVAYWVNHYYQKACKAYEEMEAFEARHWNQDNFSETYAVAVVFSSSLCKLSQPVGRVEDPRGSSRQNIISDLKRTQSLSCLYEI